MKRLGTAVLPVALLSLPLAACGSGSSSSDDSHAQAIASSDSRVSEAEESDAAEPGTPKDHSETYTCDGAGVSRVTVKSSRSDVTVNWSGAATQAASGFTEYVVTINRDDGNKVHMLYQRNEVSGPSTLSIFDTDTTTTRIVGDGSTSGTQTFPGALSGFGSQGWNGSATVNIDGNDVAHCS